jgi:mRNA-degrading endonuclease toxin of MazEF toxin-antitoxin module
MRILPDSAPNDDRELQPQLTERLIKTKDGDERPFLIGIRRGMIFWGEVKANETRGSEHFHGVGNPCPWLVISSDRIHSQLPIVTVVPLSSKLDKELFLRGPRVRIPRTMIKRYRVRRGVKELWETDSLVLTEQIRVFSHERLLFEGPVAELDQTMLSAVEAGIKDTLDFE